MNRKAILAVMATVSSLLVACGSNTDVNLGSRPQFSNGTAVLTVLIFDGVTGEELTGATVQLRVGPNVLEADADGNAYTFTNVPSGVALPISATANEHLDFAGVTGTLTGGYLADPYYNTATVVMFPDAGVGHDVRVSVVEEANGVAVTAGTVLVTMGTPAALFATTLASPISGTYGYQPAVQSLTLSGGAVTIPAASFVYGATYTARVIGASINGLQLVTSGTATTFNPATDYADQVIFMSVAGDGDYPVVLSADNEDGAKKKTLTIKFAQLIDVDACNVGEIDFAAITTDSSGVGALRADPAANATWALSDTGGASTLTITPAFETRPTAGTEGVVVTFSNINVRLRNTDSCVSLADLCIRTDGDVCEAIAGDGDLSLAITFTE